MKKDWLPEACILISLFLIIGGCNLLLSSAHAGELDITPEVYEMCDMIKKCAGKHALEQKTCEQNLQEFMNTLLPKYHELAYNSICEVSHEDQGLLCHVMGVSDVTILFGETADYCVFTCKRMKVCAQAEYLKVPVPE